MGLKLYNKVPDNIKKLDNFKLFKKRIKILANEPHGHTTSSKMKFHVQFCSTVLF